MKSFELFVAIANVLIATHVMSKNDFLVNKAIESFISLCGPLTCNGNRSNEILTETLPAICQECSCSSMCLVTGTCCIDYLFGLPERICSSACVYVSQSLREHFSDEIPLARQDYGIIKSCPSASGSQLKEKCTATVDIKTRLTSLPVTSTTTYLTYDNIYCAECHNDHYNLTNWMVHFDCHVKIDFNTFSSFEEIVEIIDDQKCRINTFDKNQYDYVETCHQSSLISKCNATGIWSEYDKAIDYACESINQPIGMFRNIFCYMCNLPDGKLNNKTMCPEGSNFYEACMSTSLNKASYPYKNIYSYLSSANTTANLIYDILYIKQYVRITYHFLVFTTICGKNYKLGQIRFNSETYNDNHSRKHPNDYSAIVRPWQYEISCKEQEVFSMFTTVEQLEEETIRKNCSFAKTVHINLMCYEKETLIRSCPPFSNVYIAMACLMIADDKLLAYRGYYNIFCYICNNPREWNCEQDLSELYFSYLYSFTGCNSIKRKEMTILSVYCKICNNGGPITPFEGFRAMFSMSSYDSAINDKMASCTQDQYFDDKSVCNSDV